MNLVRLLPAILSSLVLGAHFLRMESIPLVILALLLPAVLLYRHPWAARLVQFALICGAIEWVRTLFVFASERMETGQPWTRLAIILGVVAVFTLWSALMISISRPLRQRYGLERPLS